MDYGKYCYNIIQDVEIRLKRIEKELTTIKERVDALENGDE